MPETAAGRALLRRPHRAWPKGDEEWSQTLDIIEAEARALGRAEALAVVRAAVEGVPDIYQGESGLLDRGMTLAAIDNLETPPDDRAPYWRNPESAK